MLKIERIKLHRDRWSAELSVTPIAFDPDYWLTQFARGHALVDRVRMKAKQVRRFLNGQQLGVGNSGGHSDGASSQGS
jgi:hypothetical protein